MKTKSSCGIHILFIFCLAAIGMTMLLIENAFIIKVGYLFLGIGFIYGWYLWIVSLYQLKKLKNL